MNGAAAVWECSRMEVFARGWYRLSCVPDRVWLGLAVCRMIGDKKGEPFSPDKVSQGATASM